MSARPISAIVLAGGRSTRFGRDKLAQRVDGRTLLEHATAAVGQIASETIVVAAPDDPREVPEGVVVAHDSASFEGPLIGLLAGLRLVTGPVTLVVGGDMPSLVASVLRAMLAGLADPAYDAVLLEDEGRGRPLPAAIRSSPAAIAVARLIEAGERRLRALYDVVPTLVIPESAWRELDPAGQTLRDVDTPSDLTEWRTIGANAVSPPARWPRTPHRRR